MTLEEELTAAEEVIQAGRENAAQHLQRVARVVPLDATIVEHYRCYLDTSTSVAQSTIELCRRIVSTCVKSDALPSEDPTQIVHQLIIGVVTSMKAMYLAMGVVEDMAPRANEDDSPMRTPVNTSCTTRSCSFCGMAYQQGRIMAGPASNICATCTRLACGVLGIALRE